MSYYHITVGIPGSGKSTWVAEMVEWYMVRYVVCPDEIRLQLTGDMSDQSANGKVFEKAHAEWAKHVYDADPVIFDATNLLTRYRKELIVPIKRWGGLPVAHIFNTEYEVCCYRNTLRDRVVPEDVMEKMWEKFKLHVSPEILDSEGWEVVIHE